MMFCHRNAEVIKFFSNSLEARCVGTVFVMRNTKLASEKVLRQHRAKRFCSFGVQYMTRLTTFCGKVHVPCGAVSVFSAQTRQHLKVWHGK